jgi:glycosyltransferase involved in cell wall biosynthesis
VRSPLRVLTLTTLYPSAANPRHGVFVETRLRKLVEMASVDLRVIAPVPWFPFSAARFGRYARYALTPRIERRHGIDVIHPRYFTLPKVSMRLQPASIARSMEAAIEKLLEQGWDFDVIDAHYFYPDGVAAARVARRFSRPLVITARGSDINLIAKISGPGRLIRQAAEQAASVIAVSAALRRELIGLGVVGDHVEVVRNGVDTSLFCLRDRRLAREALGLDARPLVASVGNLVREKGHELVLTAVARLDGVQVAIVGAGPEKQRLQTLAAGLGLGGRARFMDNMPQAKLADLYGAADVLALGSTREGWPNVLLEAMACGTPVVATNVGGVMEIVGDDSVGAVVTRRDPEEFATALRRIIERGSNREQIRSYASRFDWGSVARRHYGLLKRSGRFHGRVGQREAIDMSPRIPHVLDYSLPLHSGLCLFLPSPYCAEQHALAWTTFQLTNPA